jgi:hypothetical protein
MEQEHSFPISEKMQNFMEQVGYMPTVKMNHGIKIFDGDQSHVKPIHLSDLVLTDHNSVIKIVEYFY